MFHLQRLWTLFTRIENSKGRSALLLLGFFFLSYVLMAWAEGPESPLANLLDYFYYFVVTAMTVGYGDITPKTPAGKLLATVVIVVSIIIFASLVGKIVEVVINRMNMKRRGFVDTTASDHIVLLYGGSDLATIRAALSEILADRFRRKAKIVVAVDNSEQAAELNADGMFKGSCEAVYAEKLPSSEMMKRAGITAAANVIIRGQDDSETVLTVLAVNAQNPTCHLIAVLRDADTEAHIHNLKRSRPVECVLPMSQLLAIQEMEEPGISQLVEERLSNKGKSNWFRVDVPPNVGPFAVSELLGYFFSKHHCLITAAGDENEVIGNLTPELQVTGGMHLFVSGEVRPSQIDWSVPSKS